MFAKSIVVFLPTDENLYNGHLGDRILFNLKWLLWRGGSYGEVGVSYDKFSTEFDCRRISVIFHRSASEKLAVDPLVLLAWG